MKMICPIALRGDCRSDYCVHKKPHEELFNGGISCCSSQPSDIDCSCCVPYPEKESEKGILPSPDSEGFWWMNDTCAYGWEVVRVEKVGKSFEITRCREGIHSESIESWITEWKKINPPA